MHWFFTERYGKYMMIIENMSVSFLYLESFQASLREWKTGAWISLCLHKVLAFAALAPALAAAPAVSARSPRSALSQWGAWLGSLNSSPSSPTKGGKSSSSMAHGARAKAWIPWGRSGPAVLVLPPQWLYWPHSVWSNQFWVGLSLKKSPFLTQQVIPRPSTGRNGTI